jgi:hypothetical protein
MDLSGFNWTPRVAGQSGRLGTGSPFFSPPSIGTFAPAVRESPLRRTLSFSQIGKKVLEKGIAQSLGAVRQVVNGVVRPRHGSYED